MHEVLIFGHVLQRIMDEATTGDMTIESWIGAHYWHRDSPISKSLANPIITDGTTQSESQGKPRCPQ
jgi:hypothetical protein